MSYTSEDYRWLAALLDSGSAVIEHPTPTTVRPAAAHLAAAALRIAANVAEPEVLDNIVMDWVKSAERGNGPHPTTALDDFIRAALQKDTSHG